MIKKLSCVILSTCFFIVLYAPMASAGIEPSPFKAYLAETIERIILRVGIMEPAGSNGGVTGPTITRLQAIVDGAKNSTNAVIAKNTLRAMDRITAVLFAPQPEPPKEILDPYKSLVPVVLDALDTLITLGFETPPEMISLATESSQLLERFTARLFAPQPEPPKAALGVNIVWNISRLTLEATPEDRSSAKMAIGALSQIEAVLFAPQPEPPKFVRPLSETLKDMSNLYFEINQSTK